MNNYFESIISYCDKLHIRNKYIVEEDYLSVLPVNDKEVKLLKEFCKNNNFEYIIKRETYTVYDGKFWDFYNGKTIEVWGKEEHYITKKEMIIWVVED